MRPKKPRHPVQNGQIQAINDHKIKSFVLIAIALVVVCAVSFFGMNHQALFDITDKPNSQRSNLVRRQRMLGSKSICERVSLKMHRHSAHDPSNAAGGNGTRSPSGNEATKPSDSSDKSGSSLQEGKKSEKVETSDKTDKAEKTDKSEAGKEEKRDSEKKEKTEKSEKSEKTEKTEKDQDRPVGFGNRNGARVSNGREGSRKDIPRYPLPRSWSRCSHSATDFFDKSDDCKECIGLPIERKIVSAALDKSLSVIAGQYLQPFSSFRCFNFSLPPPSVLPPLSIHRSPCPPSYLACSSASRPATSPWFPLTLHLDIVSICFLLFLISAQSQVGTERASAGILRTMLVRETIHPPQPPPLLQQQQSPPPLLFPVNSVFPLPTLPLPRLLHVTTFVSLPPIPLLLLV
eukprot:765372-Hanusia_phi.AAC.1